MLKKLPKRFKLMGQTITVVVSEDAFQHDERDCIGLARYRTNEIHIKPTLLENKEQLFQVFLHELIHFVFYHSGGAHKGASAYMHQEEDFVDLTASLLHQAFSTFEG